MKKLKRITCLMLVLVFAMSMVACGSKGNSKKLEELSVDDLGTKVVEAGKNDVKGLTAEGKMKMKISASMDGQSMDLVSLEADIDAKFDKETKLAKSAVNMTMSMLGQEQEETAESYIKYGEDKVTTYNYDGEEWEVTVSESEDSDSLDMISSMEELQNLDISEMKEYFSSMDTKTSDGNYVLEASATIAELLELAGEYGEEALGDMGFDADTMPDLTINFEAKFDGETYLPKSVKVFVDGDKINYEGMELEVKACEFEMEFTSYDAVSIEIPQEALDAE